MDNREIEKQLRIAKNQIKQLQQQLARSLTQVASQQEFHLCKIKSLKDGKFDVVKRNVNAETTEKIAEVEAISGSPNIGGNVMVGTDDDGKAFVLPQASGTIAVRETADGGEQVDIDINGNVTVNANSETLPIVFVHPHPKSQ